VAKWLRLRLNKIKVPVPHPDVPVRYNKNIRGLGVLGLQLGQEPCLSLLVIPRVESA